MYSEASCITDICHTDDETLAGSIAGMNGDKNDVPASSRDRTSSVCLLQRADALQCTRLLLRCQSILIGKRALRTNFFFLPLKLALLLIYTFASHFQVFLALTQQPS